jgi:hypothetical protein
MEELIKQAFLHVDVIGPHVQEGHYDLVGPDGEIILPAVWEKVIQPDWAITMHMWPMDKAPLRHHQIPPGAMPPGGIPRPPPGPHHPQGRVHGGGMAHHFMRPPSVRPGGGGGINIPPPPPVGGWPGGAMPPGGVPVGGGRSGLPPQVIQVDPKPARRKDKPAGSSVLGWMAGSKPKSGGKKYVGSVPLPAPDPLHTSPKHKDRGRYTSYLFYPASLWLPKFVAMNLLSHWSWMMNSGGCRRCHDDDGANDVWFIGRSIKPSTPRQHRQTHPLNRRPLSNSTPTSRLSQGISLVR